MMTRSPDSAISRCIESTVPSITSSSSACRLSWSAVIPRSRAISR